MYGNAVKLSMPITHFDFLSLFKNVCVPFCNANLNIEQTVQEALGSSGWGCSTVESRSHGTQLNLLLNKET